MLVFLPWALPGPWRMALTARTLSRSCPLTGVAFRDGLFSTMPAGGGSVTGMADHTHQSRLETAPALALPVPAHPAHVDPGCSVSHVVAAATTCRFMRHREIAVMARREVFRLRVRRHRPVMTRAFDLIGVAASEAIPAPETGGIDGDAPPVVLGDHCLQ